MDLNKQNQPAAGEDPDDLIAELARLVAEDARNSSKRSDLYRRQEPSVEPQQADFYQAEESFGVPEPQVDAEPAPQAPEPVAEAPEEAWREENEGPTFDFGLEAPEPVTTEGKEEVVPPETDPIAELIADAEVEVYDRDWARESEEVTASDFEVSLEHEPVALDDFDFGLGREEPQATAPNPGERDPLSEIEALIGEAARVSAESSLNGGRRVRSSFLSDTPSEASVSAAESAILAAAAAGATLRRTEPVFEPEPVFEEESREEESRAEPEPPAPEVFEREPEPTYEEADDFVAEEEEIEDFGERQRARRGIGAFVLPVAGGAVILAGIIGVYFAFFAGPGDPGEAPVLTAEAEPLKAEAEPVESTTPGTDSVVFNEIEGNTASPEDEALVSRDQTDGAAGPGVAEILAPEEGEIALANRPVRTVTVRPDGSIVLAEDSVAGSNVLPVDRPDVPDVPNSSLTADPIGEAIAQAMAGDTGAATPAAAAEPAQSTLAEPAGTEPEVAAPGGDDPNAPRPIPRPAGLVGPGIGVAAQTPQPLAAANPAPETIETAAVSPAAPAATTPMGTVGAWVQLSSQRSEEVARAGVADLQARYGSLFNGATLDVSRVDLGERGIYYRVRLPQPSLAEANAVCNAIRGQGGDCFVLGN